MSDRADELFDRFNPEKQNSEDHLGPGSASIETDWEACCGSEEAIIRSQIVAHEQIVAREQAINQCFAELNRM